MNGWKNTASMTVKELTDYLTNINPDIDVVVDGYEDGYDPIGHIHQKFVKPHSDPAWYYGKYEEGTGENTRLVLLISRN